jgi:hypothetical protein
MESKTAVEAVAFVNDYLHEQSNVLRAPSFKVVQAGQIRSLIKRLATCDSISVADAPAIVQEINKGNWDDNHKEMLGAAVDKLVTVGQAATSHVPTRKAQKCDCIENYLTDTDFSNILDTARTRGQRYEACGNILTRIKMPCPDPRVKQRLIAIMSSHDEWMQNPINAKTALDALTAQIKDLRVPSTRSGAHEHVVCFDDDPANMEAHIPGYMESVYSGEAPSVEPPITTEGINEILAGRCLRKTHKSVRDARNGNMMHGIMSPSMAMQPHGGPPTDMSTMMQPMVQMMQSVMHGCMQQMMGRMAGGGGDLDIRYGNGGGNGAGNNGDGGDAAPNELSRLKRSRTDNFWGRRHEAERQHVNAEDRKGQRPLLDAPTSRDDAGGAERGDDDVPDADDMDADNDAEAPPKVPGQARVRDALGDLESTMRDRKAVTKVTAKAKAKAKAEAKAADKAATLATKASAKAPAKIA